MPELSVIVPVYNVREYLSRCVDSILNQTFKNLEVILVDDGSTDGSGELCEEYAKKDKRIKTIHKMNGGVSSARNAGLRSANGKYIGFVDADDYLCNAYYASLMKDAEGKDVVFSNFSIDSNGKILHIYQRNMSFLTKNPLNFKLLYRASEGKVEDDTLIDESIAVFCWRAIYKNMFIKKNDLQFDETLYRGEDRIFLMNVLLHTSKIGLVENEYGYYYFQRGTASLVGQKNAMRYNSQNFLMCKNMDCAEQEVCKRNPTITEKELLEIRDKRAVSMRTLVIVNEFKYNRNNAVKKINKLWDEEFFGFRLVGMRGYIP